MKQGDHLFLVDGSGYIFRAYHALPPLNRKSDGLPVSAVLGFCNMVWKLLQDARDTAVGVTPTHFAVIFDYSSKTFRNDLYPEYKANRSAPPEDLIPQFGLIREATRAFDLPCIEIEGFEADDLIATYARLACEAGGDTTIISSDKDLMQLVGKTVSMYDPMKDRQIGIPEVIEKWGVPPEKMIELQAMTGDSVDNVPGIPGIGPKTAAQLLEIYGDLDTLLARASEIKQDKRRETIIANADKARISRELVTLKADVPVAEGLDDFALQPPNGPKLIGFLKTMEFSTLTRRVAEATGIDLAAIDAVPVKVEGAAEAHGPDMGAGAIALKPEVELAATDAAASPRRVPPASGVATAPSPAGETPPTAPSVLAALRAQDAVTARIDVNAYVCIRDMPTLKAWIDEAFETGVIAFNTKTTSSDPMLAELVGFSLATRPGRAAYVPLAHRAGATDLLGGGLLEDQIPVREALAALKPLLENASILKVAQNVKYVMVVMNRHGIEVGPFDDTMLISYVLDGGTAGGHDMDSLADKWLGHKAIQLKDVTGSGKSSVSFDQAPLDKAACHAAEDADVTLRLWQVLKPRLAAKGLVSVYERLERALVAVLSRMEQRGISIDRQILSRLSGELAQGAAALEDEIYALAGERFTIGSPKQLGDILFGRMGLPGGSKTKTGQWSTTAQLLEELAAEGYELPRKIVDWRQMTKLKSTYTDALAGLHPPGHQACPHVVCAGGDDDRAAVVVRAQPAEHPGAHGGRPQDQDGLHRRQGQQADLGRLQPDRAQDPGACRRDTAIAPGLRRRCRHPRDDRVRDVQRAGRGHAVRSTAPCQGDQFRHHLRHLGIRPVQPAVDSARGSLRLHQALLRTLSRHPRLYRGEQGIRPPERLRRDDFWAARALSRDPLVQPVDPRLQRARLDQCAPAGHGGRYHPPRHDPHRAGARKGWAVGAHAAAGA